MRLRLARNACGASQSVGSIVGTASAQSLIRWLPGIFNAQRVGVLGFTYPGLTRARALPELTLLPPSSSLSDLVAFDVRLVGCVEPEQPRWP